jgi:phosphohistidine phosphatase
MQLLIIRHAIAEDRDEFAETGASDDDRPLTPFGKRRMRRNARGLRRVAPRIDVLATSPLVRADQTARIVAEEFHVTEVETVEALRPDARLRDALRWIAKQPADAVVAVVGHEPHLSKLTTWLMSGVEAEQVSIKKGGASLLDFSKKPAAGGGTLEWLLTPAQLRSLGE